MLRQLSIVVLIVLAGCGAYQAPDTRPSPPTQSDGTATTSATPCYRTAPIPELRISNRRFTEPGEQQTVTVIIRTITTDSNQTRVVYGRQFTLAFNENVVVRDVPGWPNPPDGQYEILVHVENGSRVRHDLGEFGGDELGVDIGQHSLEVSSVSVLPLTVECTPSN